MVYVPEITGMGSVTASPGHRAAVPMINPPIIRVCVVEEDRRTREGIVKLLRHLPELLCLGAYADSEGAERGIPQDPPDVVLMDIDLGGRSGIDCVARLKGTHPQLKFVMLTAYDDSELIFESLRAGASGFLLKRAASTDLLAALKEVHRGGSPMSLPIARKVVSHFHQIRKPVSDVEKLSKREQEILDLLVKGMPYKKIADRLSISPSTVHGHLHAIYGKMHVQSRAEATAKYLDL